MTDFENAQMIWDYMRYEQPVQKADIIIGLGSADTRTADWCAKLYHDGFAPFILFTGARGRTTRALYVEKEADVYAARACELGVPEEAILKELAATNTGENITFSYQLLRQKGIAAQAIILVTKPHMLRRAYATFMKQWPDKEKPTVYYSAIDDTFTEYCRDTLNAFDHVVNVMVGDFQRIIEYPKRGLQIEQEVPSGVMKAYEALVKRGYTNQLLP